MLKNRENILFWFNLQDFSTYSCLLMNTANIISLERINSKFLVPLVGQVITLYDKFGRCHRPWLYAGLDVAYRASNRFLVENLFWRRSLRDSFLLERLSRSVFLPNVSLGNAHPTVTSRSLPCDHHFCRLFSCYDTWGSLCCRLHLPLRSSGAHRLWS